MTEISKELKIMIIIDAIVAFIYGITFLLIPEVIYASRESPYFDPHFWRLYGGTCCAFGILCLLCIKSGEWENIKIAYEFGVIWLIFLGIIDVISLFIIRYSATALAYQWVDNIFTIILAIANILIYLREKK